MQKIYVTKKGVGIPLTSDNNIDQSSTPKAGTALEPPLSTLNISQNEEDVNPDNKKYSKQLENNNEITQIEYVI